jgi:Putative prokaryotic signal transducing protein
MQEVLRSNDFVIISFAQAVLRDVGIDYFVADLHMSAVEGSIGAFPRRLRVAAEDAAQARRVLGEAGLRAWLVADGASPA